MEEETMKIIYGVSIVGLAVGIQAVAAKIAIDARLDVKRKESEQYRKIDRIPATGKAYGVRKKIDKKGIKKEESTVIKYFEQVMRKVGFDTSTFYRDFRSEALVFRKGKDIGSYDAHKGKLIIDPDDVSSTLYGALLDMVVTRDYSYFAVRGFERWSYNHENAVVTHIGYGLQKGYKDVFLKRYFDVPYRYPELAELAKLIELRIGQKTMEKLFAKGDLRAIINKETGNASVIANLDEMSTKLYERGIVGRAMVREQYSNLFIKLATEAMKKAREMSNSAIRSDFDPVDRCWMYTIYEDEMEEAKRILEEIKSSALQYKKRELLEIGLTDADRQRLDENLKRYALHKLNPLVRLQGPVRIVKSKHM